LTTDVKEKNTMCAQIILMQCATTRKTANQPKKYFFWEALTNEHFTAKTQWLIMLKT
jgi:hypothetical protein